MMPDGGVVVAGGVTEGFGLFRCDANGHPDATFGHDGIVVSDESLRAIYGATAVQPDGKILVAAVVAAPDFNSDLALFRYRADGTLDPTFGDHGIAAAPIGLVSEVHTLVVQPDGRIIVGGTGIPGTAPAIPRFQLVRFLSDGRLDETFGDDGVVVTDVTPGLRSTIFALALRDDGGILALGPGGIPPRSSDNGPLFLVHYRNDASLDLTSGGIVAAAISVDQGAPLLVQDDGRILVGDGARFDGPASVRRLLPGGTLDTSFGDDGTFVMHVRPDDISALQALALQGDGRLVGAGFSRPSMSQGDFAVARLFAD